MTSAVTPFLLLAVVVTLAGCGKDADKNGAAKAPAAAASTAAAVAADPMLVQADTETRKWLKSAPVAS